MSLYYALALAGTGANGQTREELLTFLGESDPSHAVTGDGQPCTGCFTRIIPSPRLKIANSLWLDYEFQGKPVTYKDAFIKNATAQFYASLFKVDFAKPSAGEANGQVDRPSRPMAR